MYNWRAFVAREFTAIDGVALGAAAVLLFGLWIVLPRPADRKHLRLPAALLALHLLVLAVHWAFAGGTGLDRPFHIVALLLLLTALARALFLLVVDWLVGHQLGRPMPRIFRDIIQGMVFVLAALLVLHTIGIDLGSLLTTSAILTAVLALSLQETLGNLFAGLAVQTERPFELGDWVQFGDVNPIIGRVVEINWRATKLRTKDVVEVIVPNGIIAKSTIQNFRRPSPVVRRVLHFQGPYGVPPNRVRAALEQALRGCSGVLEKPQPKIWTAGFGESGVDYQLVFFLDHFEISQDIESDVRDRILYALDRARISLPFPVREVRTAPAASAQTALLGPGERASALSQADFFDLLPEVALARVATAASWARFGKGESIVVEGDQADELFVIVEGEVAVMSEPPGGEAVTLARLGRTELFGELSLVTGVRGATVRALCDTIVLRIRHDDFRSVADETPGLGEALAARIAERQPAPPPSVRQSQEDAAKATVNEALFERIRRFFSRA